MTLPEEKIYYTYYSYESILNKPNGRGYIGQRKCPLNYEPETDPYLGSFSDKTFCPDGKIILGTYSSIEEAIRAESLLHDFFDAGRNPHFANRAKQSMNGVSFFGSAEGRKWFTDGIIQISLLPDDEIPEGFRPGLPDIYAIRASERTKDAIWIKKASKSRMVQLEELDEYLRNGWEKGRLEITEETRQNISKVTKGRIWINDYEVSKMIWPEELEFFLSDGWKEGRLQISEETKQKLSLNSRDRFIVNNGTTEKHLKIGTEIPAGYSIGGLLHTQETKEKISKSVSNTKWYNNGEKSIRLEEGEEIPEGFSPGRHPVSDETKRKLSNKKWCNNGERNLRLNAEDKIPEGFKAGCLSPSDETKQKLSESHNGKVVSEETKAKLRGKSYYNDGIVTKRFKPSDKIPDGFVKGRAIKKKD